LASPRRGSLGLVAKIGQWLDYSNDICSCTNRYPGQGHAGEKQPIGNLRGTDHDAAGVVERRSAVHVVRNSARLRSQCRRYLGRVAETIAMIVVTAALAVTTAARQCPGHRRTCVEGSRRCCTLISTATRRSTSGFVLTLVRSFVVQSIVQRIVGVGDRHRAVGRRYQPVLPVVTHHPHAGIGLIAVASYPTRAPR